MFSVVVSLYVIHINFVKLLAFIKSIHQLYFMLLPLSLVFVLLLGLLVNILFTLISATYFSTYIDRHAIFTITSVDAFSARRHIYAQWHFKTFMYDKI